MTERSVSKERKKELEQLDPFQENLIKAVRFAKQYKKQLIISAGAVLVVVFIFYGIMYSFKKAENQASILAVKAMDAYAGVTDPLKGYEKVKEDFLKLFTEYGNTTSGRLARVQYAKICYDAQKLDESFEFYKDALEIFKHEAKMENLILAALGHVSLSKNELEKAREYFSRIEKNKGELLKNEARYGLAMIYEAENKTAESRKMYEKIVEQSADSIYGLVAASKIVQLK